MSHESTFNRIWIKLVESELGRLWKARISVESESNHAGRHLSQSSVIWIGTAWFKVELLIFLKTKCYDVAFRGKLGKAARVGKMATPSTRETTLSHGIKNSFIRLSFKANIAFNSLTHFGQAVFQQFQKKMQKRILICCCFLPCSCNALILIWWQIRNWWLQS